MLPASVRIFLCTAPQDMRRSFDTLALVVREVIKDDPQSGALFVFLGKSPRRLKVLWWDRNGYCLLSKRFHGATYKLTSALAEGARMQIDVDVFTALITGVEKQKKEVRRLTRPLH